ncbi:hypothetical protein [Bacillus cereus]|uniref:hypothetical protein n=1 Tax=Bacillus cereus TaxID=1396 RepID=UPI0007777627|nr:hypothetical protein [Bacillus cereus]UUE91810.1 hypothetical protein L2I54_27955 [Bacillus cereus]
MEKIDVRPAMEKWKEDLREEQTDRKADLILFKTNLEITNAKMHCIQELMNKTKEDDYNQLEELNDMYIEEKGKQEELIEIIGALELEIDVYTRINLQLFETIDNNIKSTN